MALYSQVGPACRPGLSPQGEPGVQFTRDCRLNRFHTWPQVAASREVLPGRQDLQQQLLGKEDLPKSVTTPVS
jgi:hypothetical protein